MDLILDSIEKVGPDRKKVIEELANVKERDSIVGKVMFAEVELRLKASLISSASASP